MAPSGKPGLVGPAPRALPIRVLSEITTVVADLVHDTFGVVVGDVVARDVEAGVVGVGPSPDVLVVVDVVAGDRGPVGLPELAATRAPTARVRRSQL